MFEKASRLVSCQSNEEEANADEIDERFGAAREAFVILAEAATSAQPGKGPFHHPPPGQHVEAGRVAEVRDEVGSVALQVSPVRIDHVQHEAVAMRRPALQRSSVALVGPDPLQARKALADHIEDQLAADAIGQIGWVDDHAEQKALGVDQDVALAPATRLCPSSHSKPRIPPSRF